MRSDNGTTTPACTSLLPPYRDCKGGAKRYDDLKTRL
jgi:hypothetical protein